MSKGATVQQRLEQRGAIPLKRIRPADVDFIYDIDTDVLTVHFFGRQRPSVVSPINMLFSSLIDRGTREVVGLEINQFRTVAVQRSPELLTVLGVADIIGPDDAENVEMPAHGIMHRLFAWLRDWEESAQKKQALAVLATAPAD